MSYRFFLFAGLIVFLCDAASGAPILRINVPPATDSMPNALELRNGDPLPIWIPSGQNGPGNLFFEAWNAGDGNLNLQVSGGFSPWLTPQLSGTQPCSFDAGRTCHRVRVLFDAAGLPDGTFQGTVNVSDPNAVDSPQRVPVTIHVGGDVPEQVDFYVSTNAGSIDALEFQTPAGPSPRVTVNPAGQYLSVSSSGLGSFRFLHTHRLTGTYQPGLGIGDRQGTLSISGSSFAPDNRDVPVTLHVTDQPIVVPSATRLEISTAAGMEAPDQFLSLANRGQGALSVESVEVETESGGDWLSIEDAENNLFRVKAALGELEPGLYRGLVRFNSNAANGPIEVPVDFIIHPAGPPEALFSGVVNGASFDGLQGVAPGTIVSLFGSQLAPSIEQAADLPLPRELASTRVQVNGVDAPLFFVSSGQINLQIPFEVNEGSAVVQVIRDGQEGNSVSATVFGRSPGLFRFNIREYGAILNASQGNFPLPSDLGSDAGLDASPARPGDVLVIFATGLGPVSPVVGTGEAAPSDPLSRTDMPFVRFSNSPFGLFELPFFAGLTPGFVGLFQVNVVIPDTAPNNERTPIFLEFSDGRRTNTVEIAVER